MHEVFSKQCPMVLFLLNKTISMQCKRDFNIALNIKRENWASSIFHLLGPHVRSHQSPKKLLTFSFQIKKGTLYPAVIGIATLTQGALNGFWSAENEIFFFVSEQLVVFNLVKQTCMKLQNKMTHITACFLREKCGSLQINTSRNPHKLHLDVWPFASIDSPWHKFIVWY